MKRRFWRRFGNELGLLALLAGLFVFFSILNSAFFRLGNLQQLLTQMVELGFVTLGMSICVISGGFDLSIGTLTSLCTVALALLLTNGVNMWLCLVLVLAMSLLCGALNGLLIGYLNIQPILVTLGTSSVFTGIAVLLSKGHAISGLPEEYLVFGSHYLGVVPLQSVLLFAVALFSLYLFHGTRWGREVYLLGSNPLAARFAGIRCNRDLFWVYVYSAAMGFFAGLVLSSRLFSGRADLGDNYAMQSVAAAIFGGVSVAGGKGSIVGALLDVAIFTMISNIFNLLDYSRYLQQAVIGLALLAVLAYRLWRERKTA